MLRLIAHGMHMGICGAGSMKTDELVPGWSFQVHRHHSTSARVKSYQHVSARSKSQANGRSNYIKLLNMFKYTEMIS